MTQLTTNGPYKNPNHHLSVMMAPRSLLVIEDDLSVVHFLDLVLENMRPDLDWEYVTSGEEAVDLIDRRGRQLGGSPFSLVVTDIFLDGKMTGFDVWLNVSEQYPEMPFVITSSMSMDRYFSIFQNEGNCPTYMPKPLTVGHCQSVFMEYF